MGKQVHPNFILIDDDAINNKIGSLLIKKQSEKAEIVTFNFAENALYFIENEYSQYTSEKSTIVLLDINMPVYSGWDFLNYFEKLGERIKNQLKIYMLSSSLDPIDLEQAKENKYVIDYIRKPLTHEKIAGILTNTCVSSNIIM